MISDIQVAVINSDWDSTKNGIIEATLLGESPDVPNPDKPIRVYYTTPYNPKAGGGFAAVPNPADVILVTKPSNSEEYFYLGTAVGYNHGGTVGQNNLTGNQRLYSKGSRTTSVGLTNSRGSGLELIDEQDENDVERATRVVGSQGHRLQLNDAPGYDKVLLSNDLGTSKLEITNQTYSQGKVSCDSVNMEAGKNLFIKSQGGMEVMVDSMGGMFNLINYSSPITSIFAAPLKIVSNAIGGIFGAALGGLIDLSPGEVNIRSLKNKVNIRSGVSIGDPVAYEGGFLGVFIRTGMLPFSTWIGSIPTPLQPFGVIQMRSDGKIEILAMTGIDLKTMAGNINIESVTGTVNIKGLLTNLNPPIPFLPTTITMENDEVEGNVLGII